MTNLGLCGGYRPLGPTKIKMETSNAMAILGFPPNQAFEHTELLDMEKNFMVRIHQLEMEKHGAHEHVIRASNPKSKSKSGRTQIVFKNKTEARKINEAFQYLIQKRRRLTGRSMQINWQIAAGKSKSASNVVDSFKKNTGSGLTSKLLSLTAREDNVEDFAERKRQEQELFRQEQSELARQLAAELISDKKIKTLDQILNESNTQTEMNYWLQFSVMSYENRNYFFTRHGKKADNFLHHLKKNKHATDAQKIHITLPARIQNLQHYSFKRPNDKKLLQKRSQRQRNSKRTKHSNTSPASEKVQNMTERMQTDSPYPNVTNDNNSQLTIPVGPLLMDDIPSLKLDEIGKEKENPSLDKVKAYDREENGNNNQERQAETEDIQENASPNLNTKLSVLRRKLSHLNMNPNLP